MNAAFPLGPEADNRWCLTCNRKSQASTFQQAIGNSEKQRRQLNQSLCETRLIFYIVTTRPGFLHFYLKEVRSNPSITSYPPRLVCNMHRPDPSVLCLGRSRLCISCLLFIHHTSNLSFGGSLRSMEFEFTLRMYRIPNYQTPDSQRGPSEPRQFNYTETLSWSPFTWYAQRTKNCCLAINSDRAA